MCHLSNSNIVIGPALAPVDQNVGEVAAKAIDILFVAQMNSGNTARDSLPF